MLFSSRPDLIDSALLRPGRLDKSIFCNMPDTQDRKDVRNVDINCIPVIEHVLQILHAVGQKVSISPSINWDKIAELTEGFSGADIQALIYNAHLEVIHSSTAIEPALEPKSTSDEQPIEYTTFGGPESNTVKSKAEDLAFQRRVSSPHNSFLL